MTLVKPNISTCNPNPAVYPVVLLDSTLTVNNKIPLKLYLLATTNSCELCDAGCKSCGEAKGPSHCTSCPELVPKIQK